MLAPELDTAPLQKLVSKAFSGASFSVEPMVGGASLRKYFRVAIEGGQRAVAMFVPAGALAEEVQKGGGTGRWPFLQVRDELVAHGVDVPALYGEDTQAGWLLLEDLGDDTLAQFLLRHPETKEALYVQAARDLARAQGALASLPPDSLARTRRFDFDLLHWEIQHFREYGIEGRGFSMTAAQGALFNTLAERLARRVEALPSAFTHRDYQSRNLMVRSSAPPRLVWIDFQDALQGPRIYDMVALLNDSYQVFSPEFVEARLDDYAQAAGLGAAERASLSREFALVTVQRKLKDAGRFVFIDQVKKNPSFLKYVDPTLAKVERWLTKLSDDDDMAQLRRLLHEIGALDSRHA